jgi:hypothetical protein
MMVKKLKVKRKTGELIDFPANTVKKVLSSVGFAGDLLMKATNDVFKEVKKLAKQGVVSVTNLEKAIVDSVANTNKIAIKSAQKMTKKVLK